MEITCPHCHFSGNLRDDLIPESGSAVSCPKCRKKFLVTNDIPTMEPADAGDVEGVALPSSSTKTDVPVSGSARRKSPARKDAVKTLFVAFGLIFGMFLCFVAGRLSVASDPLNAAPAKPATAPSPTTSGEGTTEAKGLAADFPLIVVPQERLVAKETVEAATIDKKMSDALALADPERKAGMEKLAGELVGKNVSGVYLVKRVEKVLFFFDALLPGAGESRYLEAEADTKSPVHARVFLTSTGKDTEMAALEKARKVFLRGYVASCRSSDVLEIGLTNAQVRVTK